MKSFKFFKGSFLFSIVGAIAAYMIGGFHALFLVMALSILEVSLSFDNAVVNATVLNTMDKVWVKRFLTWGLFIAVFGMRVIFPIAIVSIIATVPPWEALQIALYEPHRYQMLIESAHMTLMGFGGTFLLLVGLEFFLNEDKEDHWIPIVERPLSCLKHLKYAQYAITMLGAAAVSMNLSGEQKSSFLIASVAGTLSFIALQMLSGYMESKEKQRVQANSVQALAKNGLAAFLYLEVLDASFSFDGVIGAFAVSNDLFIIAIGLGVGAMFVRSLTIMLVEHKTVQAYQYLEHGAFYAIIALAVIMLLQTFMHVPELLTCLIGMGFIVSAVIYSSFKQPIAVES